MIRKILMLLPCLIVLASFPSMLYSAGGNNEITVSAAMTLKNAFEEIGKLYQLKYPDAKVIFNFSGSGDLARQIIVGAPIDVFAPASQKDMDTVEKEGAILKGTRFNFAGNSIVLIAPLNTKNIIKSFTDLTSEKVLRIAIANPKTSPAGRYAVEVLEYYDVWKKIQGKVVFGENVRQVFDYAAQGEVDAAVVYSTDAVLRGKEVNIIAAAPIRSHTAVVYPIAVVKTAKNIRGAKDFINTVLSNEGRKIFKKYGFKIAQ